ncbi:MAG: hypothetical protein K0S80_5035, partial [Neobacillus sp.]|nr:hypothetical protein [Neobacillus sp.]
GESINAKRYKYTPFKVGVTILVSFLIHHLITKIEALYHLKLFYLEG